MALPAAALAQTVAFSLEGVTVYDPTELLSFATLETIQRDGAVSPESVALTLQTIYREDGYFLAEAFVAQDGQTLVVDEGRIGEISIEGMDAATFELARRYTEPLTRPGPVTLPAFERALMLIEDIESISATAEVDYPDPIGAARLRLIASPEDRAFGSVTLDHPERRIGEAATLTFSQAFLSAVTPGDLLRFDLSLTEDFDGGDSSVWGAAAYRMPLGGSGAYGELYLANVAARRDATATLEATDIRGDTAILALGYPVIRDVETYGYALFELRRSGSEVDVPATDFDSVVDAASASWIYGKTLPGGGAYEVALSGTAGRQDTDAPGLDPGDETFAYLRGGVGLERPVTWFGPDSAVRAELWGQYSNNRLPGIEEFYLGGRRDERGYLFAEAQGDSGASFFLEAGRYLFPATPSITQLRPFAFFDAGHIENRDASGSETGAETFASVGFGLDAEFTGGMSLQSRIDTPLIDGPSTRAGDAAAYFSLTKTW
ncbi:ShlB/FhaC/HecB family hemolysin secretion/activation protein [Roseivivax lentus]|nr:ShlB/FhaC/HecB family hemolysin secretion/activation protein [Roseivivax lentus]